MKRIFAGFAGLLIVLTMGLFGCGGGSSGSAPKGGSVATKGVMYPVVVGLSYQTNSGSGVVASDGGYNYKTNENVTFSAGGVELATVPAAAKVTPLPLDDDVASKNLLRLLKALDTDGDLSNGISLSQLATSTLTSVDLTSEASVAAALASLKPAATLPATSDVQVATALDNAKTTALQNMGSYGSTYKAVTVDASTLPGLPKNAVVNLTSQPNWTTGAITGTAVLTLNDNSTLTLPINNVDGNYTVAGSAFDYKIEKRFFTSRVITLSIGLAQQTNNRVWIMLRDNAQPNIPPVANFIITEYPSFNPNVPSVYHCDTNSMLTTDYDGIVVSRAWSSSKGKTGTGNTFTEDFLNNEKGSITLTVTDDEGATVSKTWQVSGSGNTTASTLTLTGDINSSLTLNYELGFDHSTVESNLMYSMINGTDSPVYISLKDYSRGWSSSADGTSWGLEVAEDAATHTMFLYFYGWKGTTAFYYPSSLGTFCAVGPGPTPSCASIGINMNRSTGVISFLNTSMKMYPTEQSERKPDILQSGTFTINGTLSFTPF